MVGIETGGKFGNESVQLLRLLARHRATSVPAHLRPAAITSWVVRGSPLRLSVPTPPHSSSCRWQPSWAKGPMHDLHEASSAPAAAGP